MRLRVALDLPPIPTYGPRPSVLPVAAREAKPRRVTVAWWPRSEGGYRGVVTVYRGLQVAERHRYVAPTPRALWRDMARGGLLPRGASERGPARRALAAATMFTRSISDRDLDRPELTEH